MKVVNPLTDQAKALLSQLRVGSNTADPRASIGAFAYGSLARAFFSNSIALCNYDGMTDFRVYGVLYSVRHGLELMLKCIVRNEMIDSILRTLMIPKLSFDDVCSKLNFNKPKEKRKILLHAICVLRNILEDGIIYPECHEKNINDGFAQLALECLRQRADLPRDRFALAWTSTAFGHDLVDL